MRVFLSEDEERKFAYDEDSDFVACFAWGEWFDRKVVDIANLRELDPEEETYEADMIVRQARKALRIWA